MVEYIRPDNDGGDRSFSAHLTDRQHEEINASDGEVISRKDGGGKFRILPGGEKALKGGWVHQVVPVE